VSDWLKNFLIGLFTTLGVGVFIFLVFFMEPKLGDDKKTLHVRFSNIASLNVGTLVTIAGKPVGDVKSIRIIPDAREQPVDEMGNVYYYELTLKVDSSVEIYNTDEVTIRTTGLLGEKSIAIIPKGPKKGQVPVLITNQIIYATSSDPLESAFHHVTSLADKLEGAVSDIDEWFVENREELSDAVKGFANAMNEGSTFIKSLNQDQISASVRKTIDLIGDNLKIVENILCDIDQKQMVSKVDYILDNIATTTDSLSTDGKTFLHNLTTLSDNLVSGKGTLGKLFYTDDVYLQTSAILSKADALMNDINHYGLLFQYDKGWQRQRTKRANLLEALNTPKAFKSYFEQEMNDITTALSRLSLLIDKSKDQVPPQENNEFKREFKALLLQVDELSNLIKLYNEQMMEKKDP
jgi:phospholipid/cholesterol/gamma-HCH transport system substrate-binding protein